MDLIVLHGPPGVGKQTIGDIVAARMGYPFLSSHRMMAEAGGVFGWGSAPFLRIRDAVVAAVQAEVAGAGPSGLIWAVIFEPTVDVGGWNELFASVDRVLVVDLQVTHDELARRLLTEARRAAGKGGTIEDVGPLVDRGVFALPALSAPVLTVDTSELSAEAVAAGIVARVRR
jgi:hypothetical protein